METLPASLKRLIDLLAQAAATETKITPLRARELVLAANVQEVDLMPYAAFDHPVQDCYGRKLVYDNGNFEVMVMSWNPGDYSSIHNHGYTQWGVVQVFGNTHHFLYEIRDEALRFARREILPSRTAIKVNNQLIHQMGNPSTERYLTLHVYGSNERSEKVTADAMNFDLEFDRISHTTGGAFFNLPENEIYDFEPGPMVADDVMLHYAHLLINYYNRQPYSEHIENLKRNILAKVESVIMMEECA